MKYLFRATFDDGTELEQLEDDSSMLAPGSKSSFYDVLETSKKKRLSSFDLITRPDTVVASVDHRTGLFTIPGVGFAVPGCALPPGFSWIEGDPDQGCYFRPTRVSINVDSGEELAREVRFAIGTKAQAGVRNFLEVQ